MAFFPRYSPIDLAAAGARRKNATRETTSTLKAWLYEHRKNPYPTKGEKIMLAIITKMTLTQVSTWFANARRRLKKENKMTWSPRNRCGEKKDDADEDEDGVSDSDFEEHSCEDEKLGVGKGTISHMLVQWFSSRPIPESRRALRTKCIISSYPSKHLRNKVSAVWESRTVKQWRNWQL